MNSQGFADAPQILRKAKRSQFRSSFTRDGIIAIPLRGLPCRGGGLIQPRFAAGAEVSRFTGALPRGLGSFSRSDVAIHPSFGFLTLPGSGLESAPRISFRCSASRRWTSLAEGSSRLPSSQILSGGWVSRGQDRPGSRWFRRFPSVSSHHPCFSRFTGGGRFPPGSFSLRHWLRPRGFHAWQPFLSRCTAGNWRSLEGFDEVRCPSLPAFLFPERTGDPVLSRLRAARVDCSRRWLPMPQAGALRDASSQLLADLVSSSLSHSAVYREADVPWRSGFKFPNRLRLFRGSRLFWPCSQRRRSFLSHCLCNVALAVSPDLAARRSLRNT